MTFDAIKIFCDVARRRSFSRGAAAGGVSQSAASQAVSQIEKHLGVQLIDRSVRPIALTTEGAMYYEACRDMMERYVAVESQIRAGGAEGCSRVRVAAIYSLVLYNLKDRFSRGVLAHEIGGVDVAYLHPDEVVEGVLDDSFDLGLISYPKASRQIEALSWRAEPMTLVCAPGHRLAAAAGVTMADLGGEAFVGFDSGLAIRRKVDGYLRKHGVEVDVVMTFDNIEAIKRGVETGAGMSILPVATVRREVQAGMLVGVRVEGLDLVRELSIIHRRGRRLRDGVRSVIDLLRSDGLYRDGVEAAPAAVARAEDDLSVLDVETRIA